MRDKALKWLYGQLRRKRQYLGHAEYKLNVPKEEIERLEQVIEMIEWIIGKVLEGDDEYGTEASKVIEINEDFESILICAERYACGRRTYMPSIVVDYIEPLIPRLSTKNLVVIGNDLSTADKTNNLGHPQIDAPLWLNLHNAITEELKKRNAK